jgi:hypothetical protein
MKSSRPKPIPKPPMPTTLSQQSKRVAKPKKKSKPFTGQKKR